MKDRVLHKLGDFVDILSGFAFDAARFGDTGEIPIARIRDVVRGRSETFYTGEYDPKYVIGTNDILVGMDGEFNRAKWSGGSALLNQRVCRIRSIHPNLDEGYLYHFLPAALKSIEDATTFVTVKHLSVKTIRDIQTPLPPLDEQKRIAAVLDKADDLRRERRDSLQLTDKLLQSVFIHMFGTEEQPLCPRAKLSDHLDFITSGGRGWSKYYAAEGDKFIRSLDVRMNEINDSEMVRVKAPKNAEADRTRVCVGDVLLTITGSLIGRVAPVSERHVGGYISQHVAILRTHGFLPEFLAWAISMEEGQRQIRRHQTGQTKPGLNFEQIGRLMIPRPSEIAEATFSQLIQRRNLVLLEQRKALEQTNLLFSSIQQRAFRGELDLGGLRLDEEAETSAVPPEPGPVIIQGRYKRPGKFIAPPDIEAQMMALEDKLDNSPDEYIKWSDDYFKYRTLSQVLNPPFGFADIWKAVERDIEEPSYETVKEKVFAFVAEGTLAQEFDDERKEIVFQQRT